ncbi:hypothetical protein [Streptomyces mirabilis]|uniref:SbtR family transcriptional regulator n=1 Tax=Streptomyces mirabilis TaxID=68239 RepID=UPI0031BAF72B
MFRFSKGKHPLAARYEPAEALAKWLQRFAGFIATKRGLSAALHSGDPAYDTLPSYFQQRFMPVLGALLDTAAKAGEIRSDVDPEDLLVATRNLTLPAQEDGNGHTPHDRPARRRTPLRRPRPGNSLKDRRPDRPWGPAGGVSGGPPRGKRPPPPHRHHTDRGGDQWE